MKHTLRTSIFALIALVFLAVIFWGTQELSNNDALLALVERFGVFGIFLVSLITNINLLIPIHAASFTPLFLASGFTFPVIVIMLVVGTTCADLLAYILGRLGKTSTAKRFPDIHKKCCEFVKHKRKWVLPGIFLYSAFVPFPNEVAMLPLGLMGFDLRKIILPLVLGTIVNQTIFALGFTTVFGLVF